MAKFKNVDKQITWQMRKGKLVKTGMKKSVKVRKQPRKVTLKQAVASIKDDKIKAEAAKQLAREQTYQMAVPEVSGTAASIASTIKSGISKSSGLTKGLGDINQNIDGGLKDTQKGRDDDEERDYPGAI